jgi:c(7)-type cytochrome triheme protein
MKNEMSSTGLFFHYVFPGLLFAIVLLALAWSNVGAATRQTGEEIYNKSGCSGCHDAGVLDAPKIGVKKEWQPRLKNGFNTMVKHAIQGHNKMPAKGGNLGLDKVDIENALKYMLSKSGFTKYAKDGALKKGKKPKKKKSKTKVPSGVNTFNRLMKPPSDWNPPPMKDGIHDPQNPETAVLQKPRDSFTSLPKSLSGNRVDWVKALHNKDIMPRYDRDDPDAVPVIMDLNIVREVKGSMPDVVYPHKQHTEWLDCSNCHPAIFKPEKGANQISMASILLGQQCGVCHGKVAFPVSQCRKCHSKKKANRK